MSSATISSGRRALHDGFENRQQRLQAGELLLVQQDVWIFELGDHLLRIGDEIRAQIAAVELHSLDDIELGFERLRLLDGDDTLVADLLHGLGQHPADLGVAIGRDGADLRDLVVCRDLLRALLDVLDDRVDRHVDAALEIHRVHPRGHRLDTLAHHGVGENGRGRRAVAGDRARLAGHLAHHLRAHVLELVGELDFLGDGDAVLGDPRRAVALVENDVAALGPQGHPDRIGEYVDAVEHPLACIGAEANIFSSHVCSPIVKQLSYSRRRDQPRP